MANRKNGPRHGSMQFWPRKRSENHLGRVNWAPLIANSKKPGFLGFIGYKAGMSSAYVKDNTADSQTKNKRIIVPVTIIECPPIKIFSVRFYKNGVVKKDIINENVDKELRRKVKLPKTPLNIKQEIEKIEKENDFDDVRVIAYSQPKKAEIKKTPDIIEIGISGTNEDKLKLIKENLSKEISISEVFSSGLVDIRGLTRGHGNQGPVRRFGIRLRSHKAEKGQRRPGSVGAWHPTGVRFNVPRAGQLGLFSRVTYNSSIIAVKKSTEKNPFIEKGLQHYGKVNADYIILRGSVQGVPKREILMTASLRPSKKQLKKQFEFIELR